MSVGSVDNTIQQQNPYANRAIKPQDEEAEGKVEGTGKTEPSKPSQQPKGSQDEYIPSVDKPEKGSGVYRLEKDGNGNQKVTVDRPATEEKETEEQTESSVKNEESSKTAEGSQKSGSKPMKSGGAPKSDDEDTSTTTSTDSVDAEIEKLKKRRAQLQKQLQDTEGDESQRKNIEKQLAQLDAEIILKDSDAYRKQNATYTA
ncbi:MAG: hypothetical protein EOM02_06885 [Synergistales bacterium]|nr:hypothetical protein [Synergistales bacterium]